jgi:Predicted HD superfamily hydrolase
VVLRKEIIDRIDIEILEYIEKEIFPKYTTTSDKGHSLSHIQDVIERSFVLLDGLSLGLDPTIVYVIAAYHDIGRLIDDDNHEKVSADMFLEDEFMKKHYDEKIIKMMAEAIEDHRASINYEPRNIYGKLVSSADRNHNLMQPLTRTYQYRQKHNPDDSLEEKIRESYEVLKKKFGINGYADKVWFDDGSYEKYLSDLRSLMSEYDIFRREYLLANEIDEYEYYLSGVDKELIRYVETKIFPEYDKNDAGHNIEHIKTVILRSFELIENLKLEFNSNLVYVIATFHDLGKYIDHENHEKIAAKMFLDDQFIKNYFTEDERYLMAEAIEDHRSSFEDTPRSDYGKLISSADRNTSIESTFKRSYEVGKWRNPDQTIGEFLDFNHKRLQKRYSVDNLENMFYLDIKYENYIKDIRLLLESFESFKERYCRINLIDVSDLSATLIKLGKEKVKNG